MNEMSFASDCIVQEGKQKLNEPTGSKTAAWIVVLHSFVQAQHGATKQLFTSDSQNRSEKDKYMSDLK